MECEFASKVSLMIDGALSPDEASQFKSHIEACVQCSRMFDEFLSLRATIKSLAPERDRVAERRALVRIISPGAAPIWNRRISVPVPVAGILIAAFLALFGWSLLLWTGRGQTGVIVRPAPVSGAQPSEAESDLSRFDHDKLPVIVKVRLQDQDRDQGRDQVHARPDGGNLQ